MPGRLGLFLATQSSLPVVSCTLLLDCVAPGIQVRSQAKNGLDVRVVDLDL